MANNMKSMKRKENSLMKKIMLNNKQKSLLKVIMSMLIICYGLLSFSQAAPTDIQPANQMPQQQINNNNNQQPASPSSVDMQNNHHQVPQKLPNINVYISRQEIKKLLGKLLL